MISIAIRFTLVAIGLAAVYPLGAWFVDIWCTLVLGRTLLSLNYSMVDGFAMIGMAMIGVGLLGAASPMFWPKP